MPALTARKTKVTMRSRPARTGSDETPKRCDALKDEVYRQMFRVEERRSGADRELALALLRAWMVLDAGPRSTTSRKWLRSICPICMELIQSSRDSNRSCNGRRSCA